MNQNKSVLIDLCLILKKIESGKKVKKDHVGVIPAWEEQACILYVNSLPDDTVINFSALAKQFKLLNSASKLASNAGQILKEIFLKKNINFERLSYRGKTAGPRFRRRKRKINKIVDISVPCDLTNEAVKAKMKELILDGTYTAGEPVVPQTFQRHFVDKESGKVCTEEFTVSGRKLSLQYIRHQHFERYSQFYRIFSDKDFEEMERCDIVKELDRIDELKPELLSLETTCLKHLLKKFNRTRYLQFWHDGSCIANHSHLLLAVNVVYDKAIFYTDDEFKAINGRKIDIQSEIETPFVYLVARCPSDDHQLMYSDIRVADIKTLKDPLCFREADIFDEVRFFHGDGPACELEAGQQKNGHYPCWICPANFNSRKNSKLEYLLPLPQLDLHDRSKKILASEASQKRIATGQTKLYAKLKVHEIIEELHQRGIKYSIDHNKDVLSAKLVSEMHGMQRLPLLVNPDLSILESFLSNYEILGCEPLHDIKHHTEKLYTEIPQHLSKIESKLMLQAISDSFCNKEVKRGVDYRISLIYINQVLLGKIDKTVFAIFSTLCEIQKILYSSERERTM